MKNLYDLDFLIPLILLRGRFKGIREGMVRFQITKVAAWTMVNSGIFSVQSSVYIYRYGPYILKFEDVLVDLVRRNIIEYIIDSKGQTRFCLTDEGERWLVSRLRNENYRNAATLGKEIDRCIFTPISDIILEIAEKSPLLRPVRKSIGDKELIRVFDWRNAGDGKVHGYHYTLLRSFYRLEDHFLREIRKANAEIEAGENDYRYRIVEYASIPEVVMSENFFKDKKGKHTMRYIFNKNDPKSIRNDKFEGKNYVGNLWYIYSAINIIHILAGLAPTIDEVARICLTLYEHKMEQNIPFSTMRKMRESAVRPDMFKFAKYGVLNKKKIGKYYVYTIRAKKIIDSFTSDTYSVLGEDRIWSLYRELIRPDDRNIGLIREIISEERELQEVAEA